MSTGAILIGLAAAMLLAIYAAQPFRRRPQDLDALIERWVAQERRNAAPPIPRPVDHPEAIEGDETAGVTVPPDAPPGDVNYCHQCGHRVQPHHRFCPHCGARLTEDRP